MEHSTQPSKTETHKEGKVIAMMNGVLWDQTISMLIHNEIIIPLIIITAEMDFWRGSAGKSKRNTHGTMYEMYSADNFQDMFL